MRWLYVPHFLVHNVSSTSVLAFSSVMSPSVYQKIYCCWDLLPLVVFILWSVHKLEPDFSWLVDTVSRLGVAFFHLWVGGRSSVGMCSTYPCSVFSRRSSIQWKYWESYHVCWWNLESCVEVMNDLVWRCLSRLDIVFMLLQISAY